MLERGAAAVTARGRLPIIVYRTLHTPCPRWRPLSFPLPSPRVSLTRLIYYSRSGCFINCLSLRIKPTRVGGRDKTPHVNQLPPPLFSLFLYLLECSLAMFAYPYIWFSLALPLAVCCLAPRATHATRYLHATSISLRLITSRPISVSYPCLHRKSC